MSIEKDLTTAIVAYLLANFGVLDLRPVSLRHQDFRTSYSIEFFDGFDHSCPIYACQTVINGALLKIAFVKLASNSDEYADADLALLISLEGCPTYGCALTIDNMQNTNNGFIACKFKDTWMPCSIYTQSTFLAGMEQIKDLMTKYEKCKDAKELHQDLKGFLSYQETLEEVSNGGD
jgi:hypothetical protein